MSRGSLTVRLAMSFTLLAIVVLGAVGSELYRGLETQLALRDDAALVNRVEQIRSLLQDDSTIELVHEKPRLFENMLGNREALLVVGFQGQAPLIYVNPVGTPVPLLEPVASGAKLTLAAVRRSSDASGTPFSAVSAYARIAGSGQEIQITAGRLMIERSHTLYNYGKHIILLVACGATLAAAVAFGLVTHGMRSLRQLAAETSTISINNLARRIDGSRAPSELSPVILSFNAMLARLDASFAQLSQVSADMAHDLRTPINNLLGQTEVALGQVRDGDYYQNLLASNLEELQRISRMTDNMLFLARSDHGDSNIALKALDVAAEFERVADYFEGLADERQLRVVRDGTGVVSADPTLLRRALANLLANAVQYADAGSDIIMSAQAGESGVRLSVENVGPVIAEHHLARLFERFYRADTSRRGSAHASGLGLAIVRSIMALHGGCAAVSSTNGKTRFTLTFPAPDSVRLQ